MNLCLNEKKTFFKMQFFKVNFIQQWSIHYKSNVCKQLESYRVEYFNESFWNGVTFQPSKVKITNAKSFTTKAKDYIWLLNPNLTTET